MLRFEEKTKQERVRDNQRRSRARRKEHLADLEKQLTDNHALYRDADLQRSAYADLQTENACLRTLLNIAGVSPTFIQSFVDQHTSSAISEDMQCISGPSHRPLKPKPPPTRHPAGHLVNDQSTLQDDILSARPDHSRFNDIGSRLHTPHVLGTSTDSPPIHDCCSQISKTLQRLPHQLQQAQHDYITPTSVTSYGSVSPISQTGLKSEETDPLLCSVTQNLLERYGVSHRHVEGIGDGSYPA